MNCQHTLHFYGHLQQRYANVFSTIEFAETTEKSVINGQNPASCDFFKAGVA